MSKPKAGDTVNIHMWHSDPGKGLSYDARTGILADDCGSGWDVVDLTDGTSVYSFSVYKASESEANVSNRDRLLADMEYLAHQLIPQIDDDYRIEGPDAMSWSYQTGDNSFTGGAYSYAHWGIGYLTRDTSPADFARDIVMSLEENNDFEWETET